MYKANGHHISRQDIIAAAREQDADIGPTAMITEMEWGYWVAGVYVRKDDVVRRKLNWLKSGAMATLKLNDAFGSTMEVRVVKVQKGGNVLVNDGDRTMQVGASNLSERN